MTRILSAFLMVERQVRNDERGMSLRQRVHCLLNQHFCACIDGGRRFVENQHRRVFNHRAGNRHQLLLSGGEVQFVGQQGVVTLRQGVDKVVQPRCAGHLVKLLVRNALLAVAEVVADAALEEPSVLQDHAEEVVHMLARHLRQRHAVNANFAAVQRIELHQQIDHRGFARASRPTMATF